MVQKKSGFLRFVAWVCTAAMWVALCGVAYLLCRLGESLIDWLGTLSTIAVVILTLLLGGAFIGLFTNSVWMLPTLLAKASDKIYPSRRGTRFYVIGGYMLLGCAIVIIGAIVGAVRGGGSMFWLYVRFIYIAVASIIAMVCGYVAASERNSTEEGAAALEKDKQKQKRTFTTVAITAVMWGIARAVPVFMNAVYPLGIWVLFVSMFLLPFGWWAALAISKGRYSMCVRINLYVMAALEGVGAFETAVTAMTGGEYRPVVYLVWVIAAALYVGLCIYLAGMVDKVKG